MIPVHLSSYVVLGCASVVLGGTTYALGAGMIHMRSVFVAAFGVAAPAGGLYAAALARGMARHRKADRSTVREVAWVCCCWAVAASWPLADHFGVLTGAASAAAGVLGALATVYS